MVVGRERTNMGSALYSNVDRSARAGQKCVDWIESGRDHTEAHRNPEGVLSACQDCHADSFIMHRNPKPPTSPSI